MKQRKRVAIVSPTNREENLLILRGIATYLRNHEKWNAMLDNDGHAVRDPAWLFQNKIDGVVSHHRNPSIIHECLRRGIPCVDINDETPVTPGVPKIRPDNVAIGQMGAEYLADRGFKNFGFCGFDSESWSLERLSGFKEAVAELHLKNETLETHYTIDASKLLIDAQDDWAQEQETHISQWVKSLPKPVAIMGCNDLRAGQVLQACLNLGLSIPDEVAILGANDEVTRCELHCPSLSSIPVNAFHFGESIARTLDALMAGYPPDFSELLIEPLGVETRQSTDVLAVDDANMAKVMRLIRARACSGLRVEDLVIEAGVSRSQLEKRFRKSFGKSPQAAIRQTQISKAKSLLANTNMTLAEIASQSGYTHTEYMYVVFRRETGETPGAFRSRMKLPD